MAHPRTPEFKLACHAALVMALFGCALSAGASAADDTSALINQALDKQVKLTLNNVLPAAMDAITKQTGVPISADPIVYDLLPWGQDTNITAKIENQTLREALTAITRKLGLTFKLRDQVLELEPMPALRRLGRRSTVEELGGLDRLASTPLNLGETRPTIKKLIDAVDASLAAAKTNYAIEDRLGETVREDELVSIPRNASMLEALEAMTKQSNATWYPWGKTFIIVSKQFQVRRELNRSLTVRYEGVDLAQVLTELQKRTGVKFDIEPGALQQVSPEARNIHLRLDNGTVEDALDALRGVTGLDYTIKDQGIYIWSQSSAAPQRDPVVAIIVLPDSGTQLLLHESEIPPDVRAYLLARKQKEIKRLREQMTEEGFKPATQPAKAPAATDPDL